MQLLPERYLAEGTVLTFATRKSALFDAVIAALSNAPAPEERPVPGAGYRIQPW
jgi:hypothetical protein